MRAVDTAARSRLYFNHRYRSLLPRFLPHGLLFFHAGEAEDGARSDHTYRSRPTPLPPPDPHPPAICARLSACKLLNIEALNLRRGVNPSPEKRRNEAESRRKRRVGEGGELVGGGGATGGGRGEEKRK